MDPIQAEHLASLGSFQASPSLTGETLGIHILNSKVPMHPLRLGLQRYLQSKGTGKMIVLDEAHKVLGARVIIST
jgi:hypothetical protein